MTVPSISTTSPDAVPMAPAAPASCATASAWPKNRILFLMAGAVTLTGTVLAASVSRWFLVVPGMVGVNQLLMVSTGWCPASSVLDRILPPERR